MTWKKICVSVHEILITSFKHYLYLIFSGFKFVPKLLKVIPNIAWEVNRSQRSLLKIPKLVLAKLQVHVLRAAWEINVREVTEKNSFLSSCFQIYCTSSWCWLELNKLQFLFSILDLIMTLEYFSHMCDRVYVVALSVLILLYKVYCTIQCVTA